MSNKLMVEAKVENDMENLMGLIHGLTLDGEAKNASIANTGTASTRAQPSRESTRSLASSSRKNSRTDEGEAVCIAARTKAVSQPAPVCVHAGRAVVSVHRSICCVFAGGR